MEFEEFKYSSSELHTREKDSPQHGRGNQRWRRIRHWQYPKGQHQDDEPLEPLVLD
jgi:hypothetical protein